MQRWLEFRRPLFVGAALLYGIYQLSSRVLHWPLPTLLTSYLADLVAMPILLSLALAAQRRFGLPARSFVLPDAWLLTTWAGVSVWFEGILPLYSAAAVADPLDVVAYAAGTLAFRHWLNKPA